MRSSRPLPADLEVSRSLQTFGAKLKPHLFLSDGSFLIYLDMLTFSCLISSVCVCGGGGGGWEQLNCGIMNR